MGSKHLCIVISNVEKTGISLSVGLVATKVYATILLRKLYKKRKRPPH